MTNGFNTCVRSALTVAAACLWVATLGAGGQGAPTGSGAARGAASAPITVSATASQAEPLVVPADYVIGAEDVLTIQFWKEADMSGDVPVRPDGKISLPLVNDVDVAGLTIEQLRLKLNKAATPFLTNPPNVAVQVKQINSRRVFITGLIAKPGAYPHLGPMDVLTLITLAGGLQDFANEERIVIIRTENGVQTSRIFDYSQVKQGKRLEQNIQLKPGDRIIVPD
jgi:polysaccharide export outer membrane protein